MRVGIGFDSHPLKEGRRLFLGGCEIPYPKGLFGHSDGDVVIHSIVDAILGALGKEDIGSLFPDTEERYKNISSIYFLKEMRKILEESRFQISNIDAIVICDEPKISQYRKEMEEKIADALGIESHQVSIKGKRKEGMMGNEGIICYAVVLLVRI